MKILAVTMYYHPEPFRITDICEELVRRGHEVQVLTSVPNIPDGEFYEGYGWFKYGERERNGVKIERVNVIKRGRDKPLRLMLNCASYAFNALFHLPKLAKNDYDVVFIFNNSPVSTIYPAKVFARRKKIPYVVFVLDIWPDSMYLLLNMPITAKQTLFRKISYSISRWLYRSAQSLLISSPGMEKKLRGMGLDNTIEYFPNYPEPISGWENAPEARRTALGFTESDIVIGFAGNIGKAQGLSSLLNAAARLKARGNIKFLIAGDGSELLNLKAQAEREGLEGTVVFTGWLESEKLPAYMALCDIGLASLKDNEVLNLVLPAKVQTYMNAALPVIAFMNGEGAR
ncbi:MAG: glycosyltransferase family 4 protein, partial [Oscillospiraceae bacterium]|nr:glycosyltransferase family 4 protein [Oscillospiraceae bacterium]